MFLPSLHKQPKFRVMVIIRFAEKEDKRRALGFIARRFSGKSWASGELMLPDEALDVLRNEGIEFIVVGPAKYEHMAPFRGSSPAPAK
jgi:hypothetical protein